MTWYKREEPVRAGSVTSYRKESGRHVSTEVYEDQYAEVPDDEDGMAVNLLEESETWNKVDDYVPPEDREEEEVEEEDVEEEEQEETEAEDAEEADEEEEEMVTVDDLEDTAPGDLPPLEEADLEEAEYTELQAYASLFDGVDGTQKTEELIADLEARR